MFVHHASKCFPCPLTANRFQASASQSRARRTSSFMASSYGSRRTKLPNRGSRSKFKPSTPNRIANVRNSASEGQTLPVPHLVVPTEEPCEFAAGNELQSV